MQKLTRKAIWFQIIMAVMLFAPAWTLHFWEAWVFWLLFSVLSAVVTFYFLKHDPGLVESRLKVGPSAEHEKSQKIIQTLTAILWCALIIVPGIERHFHSARFPAALVFVGDALVAAGYYIIFLALRENRWAASIIEVRPGQSVIFTGPYRIVRHPMYSGGVLMILATPLAWTRSEPSCARWCFAASSRRGSSTRSGISQETCRVMKTIAGRFDTDCFPTFGEPRFARSLSILQARLSPTPNYAGTF
jgi:protein-S-isoprenylcysteine O-methyltransferase Ste14